MPNKKRGTSPDWDSDLKKQKKEMQAAKAMQNNIAKRARANSKSPWQGMDGVDYEGENRWNYNFARIKAAQASMKIDQVDSQQRGRDQSRSDYNKRIQRRMKK